MKPIDLLIGQRWDIIVKYIYIKYFTQYLQLKLGKEYPNLFKKGFEQYYSHVADPDIKWLNELYYRHMKVLNGGYEEKVKYQANQKNSLEHFLKEFHQVFFSIKVRGYDRTSYIPIDKFNIPFNGAHRIAISLFLNLSDIPVKKHDIPQQLCILPQLFENRKKFTTANTPRVKDAKLLLNSMESWETNFFLQEYCAIRSEYLRFIIIFDVDDYSKHHVPINALIRQDGHHILYNKIINLNCHGTFNLIKNLYLDEPKVDCNFKNAHVYGAKMNNKYQIKSQILLIENYNKKFELWSPTGSLRKSQVRQLLGNYHAIHVSDNAYEVRRMSRIFFHQPSIDFLNSSPTNYPSKIIQLENNYRNLISKLEQLHFNITDDFMLVSSFILGLYGMRIPNDLDYIVSWHRVKNNGLVEYSHNKYLSKYYPDSIFNLLTHPKNYFNYHGLKCLSLENIEKMKIKRNEIPKDINDLKLIREGKNFGNLRTKFGIITTTHIIPTAPSTEILEQTLKSFYSQIPGLRFCKHLILVDYKPGDPKFKKYLENLRNLTMTYPNLYIIESPNSGLKVNYIKGLSLLATPYIFFLEHDWILKESINLRYIYQTFEQHPNFNLLKLSKRNNDQTDYWDYTLIQDHRIKLFKAIKTSSWSNHPHFARKSKWINSWLKIVGPKPSEKSFGIERVLFAQYYKDVKAKGFDKAHLDWGCYNYGTKSGGPCVSHNDGSENYSEGHRDRRDQGI